MNNVVMQFGLILKIKSIIHSLTRKRVTTSQNKTSKLYRSIHKLPLHIFIDCIVGKDLSKLIIEGNPSQDELEQCFEALYMDYVELAGGKDATSKLVKAHHISSIQLRVKMFEMLTQALLVNPSKEMFELLQQFTQYYPPQKEYSLEQVEVSINKMMPHYKSEKISLMLELDAMKLGNENKEQKETHYTYEYFASVLAELESVFKTPSINENMSVGKFCIWINKYKEYVKQVNKAN